MELAEAIACAPVPLKFTVLVVPGVKVPVPAPDYVTEPPMFNVPAPPLRSTTAITDVEPAN